MGQRSDSRLEGALSARSQVSVVGSSLELGRVVGCVRTSTARGLEVCVSLSVGDAK